MTGKTAEIRNHRKNDEPLMRPTRPPAIPKARAIVTYGMSELRQRPHDADDAGDHNDDRGDAGDEPDDELQQDPPADPQDEDREQLAAEWSSGLSLFVHTSNRRRA